MTSSQTQCAPTDSPATLPPEPSRCAALTSDGRQCRMARSPHHDSLCPAHARKEEREANARLGPRLSEEIAAELVPVSGAFRTAHDVNHVLGKLFLLLAQGRIARRDAMALGYLAQLLIQTLPATQREIREVLGFSHWREVVSPAIPDEPDEDDDQSDEEVSEAASADAPTTQPNAFENEDHMPPAQAEPSVCSSGLPVSRSGTGDLRLVPHATVIDHAADSAQQSNDAAAEAIAREEFLQILMAAAYDDAEDGAGTLDSRAQAWKASRAQRTNSTQPHPANPPQTEPASDAAPASAPQSQSLEPARREASAPPLSPPQNQPSAPQPKQPEPESEPEPLCTFRMPGPNGTMQELQVTAASAEAAFGLRFPPPPKPQRRPWTFIPKR